jgi:hypothetical protein
MHILRRFLCILALAAAPAAQAGGTLVVTASAPSGAWFALAIFASLLPRPAPPEVSLHHLGATPGSAPGRDSCTWVAGVRHCPLPELRPPLRAEPR